MMEWLKRIHATRYRFYKDYYIAMLEDCFECRVSDSEYEKWWKGDKLWRDSVQTRSVQNASDTMTVVDLGITK
jgi:hypothetical protein